MKVLVAEPDAETRELATRALRRAGHSVSQAIDGRGAIQRWEVEKPNLVLLGNYLPGIGSAYVCRRIRQEADVPIILLTPVDDEAAALRAVDLGADAVITKPLNVTTLPAHIHAILRRYAAPRRPARSEVSAGDITLKLQSHETTRNGKPVRLTPLEFRILYALVANRGRVIPYSRLVDLAWGEDGGDAERLRSHVCRIRQKLAMPAEATPAIKVVRGVGYRFELAA